MFWKEVMVEGGLRFRWFGWLLLAVLVVASFLTLLWIHSNHPTAASRAFINFAWSVGVGSVVACLLLLGVAARAATSLTNERDRQTLDNLLATPLDSTPILFAKWLGSVLSVRWGWLWLGTIWGLGAAFGNLHPLALALMLLAWMVYAALLATLGLWFSLICRTTQRALVWTFLCTGALGAGFLLLPIEFLFPSIRTGYSQALADWFLRIQKGLTPPVVLGRLLPFMSQGARPSDGFDKQPWELSAALLGLSIWLLAAVVLWIVTSRHFRKVTCRERRRQPERSPLLDVASESALANAGGAGAVNSAGGLSCPC
jgi:ABC-type transport system involved in multi-copper enzyme maturation permease subunit